MLYWTKKVEALRDFIMSQIKLNNVSFIEKGTRVQFNYGSGGTVYFNPVKENLLLGFTVDQKLAYFPSEDFKQVKNTSGKYTFKMRIMESTPTREVIEKILTHLGLSAQPPPIAPARRNELFEAA